MNGKQILIHNYFTTMYFNIVSNIYTFTLIRKHLNGTSPNVIDIALGPT